MSANNVVGSRLRFSVDDGPYANGMPWAIVATDPEGASEIWGYFHTQECAELVADFLDDQAAALT